jgi:hypothetical protein
VNWKEEYSTMEIFNVSYVALHFSLSVLDDRIYVFHVSELMFTGKLFMKLSVLHFKISTGKGKLITSSTVINVLRHYLELTPLFPDGVECTNLAEISGHSLPMYEFVHFPARDES